MKKFEEMKSWLAEEESGQGMVEYGLILVLISVVVVLVLGNIGTSLNSKFQEINTKLGGTNPSNP
ncbi:Flp family type IVb pilin [Clostridium sp. chh4-2]|uniref:Flp family type IVb pilin n=1 Tax=Clostridium sp. chh4-2 TaxID=2067550 RepID=UPI001A9A2D8C|nr:Flp family type IVb pilin [Clostridium sp. chh4-2]